MQSSRPSVTTIACDELEALCITHPLFTAKILLQGGQLMAFSTHNHPDNWLWSSDNVIYQLGQAVRGGIPICFPMFGNYADNPSEVQTTFQHGLAKHGVARTAMWQLVTQDLSEEKAVITLAWQVPQAFIDQYPTVKLQAHLVFEFDAQGFNITLESKNLGEETLCFTQAFHTYLPTDDIHQTQIIGFDKTHYVDMLTNKSQIVEQRGHITFKQEVDRIYQTSPTINLVTPDYTANLSSKNSLSTIIWNPWIEKSKTLDQFLPSDYEKMLCIETANAGQDFVTLLPNTSFSLGLNYQKTND